MYDKVQILEVLLKEYEQLKSEQAQRIGFRDNLLYVTLGVLGGVVSFSVTNPSNYYALLVIPWVCLILGWTYVVNDEKISSIGRYIRCKLVNRIMEHTGYKAPDTLFGWEITHREDQHRRRRKIQQLIVDEITFVLSGTISLAVFWKLVPNVSLAIYLLSGFELLLLLILGCEIFIYADLAKGR
ncbi:hypothetical protein ACSYAD_28100 [Acaryochloris marina NIES-2412]|uniref:hypothetical protein n=1 Tax=Acaryochloris marina TaxID=155978 RepID=UPI004058EBA5